MNIVIIKTNFNEYTALYLYFRDMLYTFAVGIHDVNYYHLISVRYIYFHTISVLLNFKSYYNIELIYSSAAVTENL